MRKQWKQWDFIFEGSKITVDGDCSHEIKRCLLLEKSYGQPRQHIKKQRHYFPDNGLSSQSYGFPAAMYRCESWTIKKAELWRIDAFELWCWRKLESPLDCKEVKPVNPKENQSWIFIGRTDAEAETPILWPPEAKNWLTGKDLDPGKDTETWRSICNFLSLLGWSKFSLLVAKIHL